ncbi:hypothetical protein ACFV1L_05960 [Kitasatospora sp. NPDC059646]|uniref:hypothetical protein n=1 Tax=Kitasatospora sp. NPDC059646 TaxID=3346893 RepID=UPI00369B8258
MSTIQIELSPAIQRLCDASPHYGRRDFEAAAPFRRMGVIEGPDGHMVSSDTYGDNLYNNTEEKWQHVTNARAIRDLLEEADNGCGWEYGPADSFVYDLDNPAIVAVVEEIESALSDYPFLNEDSYQEEVYDEYHPDETTCHADGECPCYANTHECSDVMAAAVGCGKIALLMDEWYCEYCSTWYEITPEQRHEIAQKHFRAGLYEAEQNGQLRLF